ncbi:DUF3995 domain-containing protein [Cohnella panacarvi]|uniref:DUF3995 domain-containing protein n=1 Tax=Cohnella panacarvi TaxID=400776 RepID=UPI00047A8B62|nr:DUF3995 domain-containing protein [Cohnella panacarvi]
MNGILGSVAAFLLFALSFIHVYWAFGGRRGGAAAIPRKPGGEALFRPRVPETVAVAIALLIACAALLLQTRIVTFMDANSYIRFICIVCAFVFFLRAIGEFKYVGFFKRVKHTPFAVNDTKYYSPLCLFLSLVYLVALIE